MNTLSYLHSEKCICITADIEKAVLFDQVPMPGEDFWLTLLCRGGNRFAQVNVSTDDMLKRTHNIGNRPVYRWYPRTLFTTLVLVSGAILSQIFWIRISQTNVSMYFRKPGKLSNRRNSSNPST